MKFSQSQWTMKHPFTCMVAGPTGSGKTYLVRDILQYHKHVINNLSDSKVLWAYGVWQELYSENIPNVNVEYLEGLPTIENVKDSGASILVVDDLMACPQTER